MISIKYYFLERRRFFLLLGTAIIAIGLTAAFFALTKKTVTVSDGSQQISVTVFGFATVSTAMAKSGIALDPYDQLSMSLDTILKQDDNVTIMYDTLSATSELLAQQEQRAFETGSVTASTAMTASIQPASVTNDSATDTPSNSVQTSAGELIYTQILDVTATAYDPSSCYPYAGTTTASGTSPMEYRTIAAWSELPFGTRVYIPYFDSAPNQGIFIVEDRGGAITENKIDIFYDNHQEALRFGRRTLQLYVLQ